MVIYSHVLSWWHTRNIVFAISMHITFRWFQLPLQTITSAKFHTPTLMLTEQKKRANSNANRVFFLRCRRMLFFALCENALLKIAVDKLARGRFRSFSQIGGWQIGDRAARARSNDDDSRVTINGSPCGWYSCVTLVRYIWKYMAAECESRAYSWHMCMRIAEKYCHRV